MPRLNTLNGKAVQGTTTISVNGVVPAALVGISAGNPEWLDEADQEVIYENTDGSPFLESIDLDTGSLTTQSTAGATSLAAGGGRWLAYLTSGSNAGVRTNLSGFGPFALAGPVAADEDGLSAIVQNAELGRGIQTYDLAGTFVQTYDVPLAVDYVVRARNGLVAFPASGGIWALKDLVTGADVPFAVRDEVVTLVVPVVADGETLVLERSTTRLTLRLATAASGYILTTVDTFNPDVIELSPGVVRIAYSTTVGEGPTTLRTIDLTVDTGATVNGTTASGSLVFTAGTPLAVSLLPAVAPGTGLGALFSGHHPFTERDGWLSLAFGKPWVDLVSRIIAQPINLATQTTGILPPGSGGTGGTGGTSIINASNVTIGTLPQNVKWTQFDTAAVGTQDDFFFVNRDVIRAANASALDLTGFIAGVPGQQLVIVAVDASVTLINEGGTSSAANRLLTSDGLSVVLAAGEGALLTYDGTSDRWRVLFTTGASANVEGAGYWSPLTNNPSINLSEQVQAVGYWTPLMTGPDAATSELVLDINGDCVAVWTQTKDGPIFPQLVDDEGDTVSVWTPTP